MAIFKLSHWACTYQYTSLWRNDVSSPGFCTALAGCLLWMKLSAGTKFSNKLHVVLDELPSTPYICLSLSLSLSLSPVLFLRCVWINMFFESSNSSTNCQNSWLLGHYRKRGSASYIVREWLLWVVERERERERERRLWRHRYHAEIASDHAYDYLDSALTLCICIRVDAFWACTCCRVLEVHDKPKPQTATLATAQWLK